MSVFAAGAQVADQAWHKLGSSAIQTGLAGPAGGPVAQLWFSPDGAQLYTRTARGSTFVTDDFENWSPAPAGLERTEAPIERSPLRVPEARVNVRAGGSGRIYAFGTNVYASDDGGRSWVNLTAFQGRSVIGERQNDLAVSPQDSQFVAVANDEGVWCSRDGGLSWAGLNDNLPNLPVRSLLPENGIVVSGLGAARFLGAVGWLSTPNDPTDKASRDGLSIRLGAAITVAAGAGDFWYAGAADGRLWTSQDARAHWTLSTLQATGPIERFAVDADAPRIAFLASSGRGPHLFRTLNGGQTWDDITGSLADVPAHGIAADRSAGALYVATDQGVFLSRTDLNAIGTMSPWMKVTAALPAAAAEDVRLEGSQLRVALDGWGVYTARAPHLSGSAKLVNAADLSSRAGAPGGLVSAMGIAVDSASAGGLQFPVLARSQIQIPFGTEPAELQLELNRTARVSLTVKAVSPAVFVDGDGVPLLLDPETGMMRDSGQPAVARSSIQLLVTGLGRVTPDWPSGVPAPLSNVPAVTADVQAYLNGLPVEVTKATLAPGYVGMYLVEIRLPALLDTGIADLYLTAAGETSNHVRLAVAY